MSMDIQNLSSEVNVALLNESSRLRARCEKLESILRQYKAAVELNEHIHTSWSIYYETEDALSETGYSKPSTINDGTEDK